MRWSSRWAILILVLWGMLAWGGSLRNQFVWDDEEQVIANQAVHSLQNLPQLWKGSTFNSGGSAELTGMYYKPVMSSMFAVLYAIGDGKPMIFHAFQVILHIVNAIMLYWVMKKVLKQDIVAWLIAMIFLVHPINVETTVYVAALQDTLSLFWGMLGLMLVMRKNNLIITGLLLLLSLLTKETGILWVAITGWYLVCFDPKRLRTYVLASLAVVGIYAYLRIGVARVGLAKHGLAAISTMSLPERLMSVPKIIVHYLELVIWPARLAIAQHWVVMGMNWKEFWVPLLTVAGLVIGGGAVGRKLRWSSSYLFFVGWTVVGLLLHLQIFPLDMTVADRWMYVPLAGMLGVVGTVIGGNKRLWRAEVGVIVGVVIVALTARSIVRVGQWRNGLALYGHDVQLNPNAFDLQNNYGVELYRIGRYEEARSRFEKSIVLSPTWWTSYNNLGAYWEGNGELEKAAELYKTAIENGQYYLAYENYARVLLKRGLDDEAGLFLREARQVLPKNYQLQVLESYLKSQDNK